MPVSKKRVPKPFKPRSHFSKKTARRYIDRNTRRYMANHVTDPAYMESMASALKTLYMPKKA